MIRAYNQYYFEFVQEKLAIMYEIAVLYEKINIDEFTELFVKSKVSKGFEEGDPVVILGKSGTEHLGDILGRDLGQIELNSYASPEYWTGWTYAFAQWYLCRPFGELAQALPCSVLCENYFPYHEMDITRSLELYTARMGRINRLKEYRKRLSMSQKTLSLISGVPIRTIRSYEQKDGDISKGQVDTVYALAQSLGCSIEDLIK